MSLQFQIPSATYSRTHVERRRQLALADDFLTEKVDTWYKNLSDANDRINDYITSRGPDIISSSPADLSLFRKARSSYHHNIVLPSYQTFFGQYANYRIYSDVSDLIKKTYEHFVPTAGGAASISGGTSVSNLEDAVKMVARLKIKLDNAGKVMSNNIMKVTTDPLYLQTLQASEQSQQNLVSSNVDYLGDFNVPPHLIGADLVKQLGDRSGSNQYSQEFIATNILGWSNSNLSTRAVGSPNELMAIFMDVFLLNIELNGFPTANPFNVDRKDDDAINSILGYGIPIYQRLLGSALIKNLGEAQATFENLPPSSVPANLQFPPGSSLNGNPMYVGSIDVPDPLDPTKISTTYHIPESLLLDVHYRTIRTPFYKRDLVNKKDNMTSDILIKFLTYGVAWNNGDNKMTIQSRALKASSTETDSIWKDLFGEKDKEKESLMYQVLSFGVGSSSIDTASLVTETGKNERVNKQIEEFCKKMMLVSVDQRRKIITEAMNGLFFAVLHAGLQNWARFTSLFSPQETIGSDTNAFGLMGVSRFLLNNQDVSMAHLDRDQFRIQGNLLRSYLGTRGDNAVGSMGMSWSDPIQSGALGEYFTYPGDMYVIQSLGSYSNMMYQDINKLRDVLTQTINRTGTSYWWRDIVRWLEILYKILDPRPPVTNEKQRFDRLSNLIRQVYLSGLNQMRNYISKSQQATTSDSAVEAQVASATMCYVKRQVQIVYYLLENISNMAPWTNLANMRSNAQLLKNQNEGAYRADVETYIATLPDMNMRKLARELLLSDVCKVKQDDTKVTYLTDAIVKSIITEQYWKIWARNLKTRPDLPLDSPNKSFYGIYVPLAMKPTFGSTYKYYLFDLMPVVLEGKFGDTGRSSPQWLNSNDLRSIRIYNRANPAVVIVSDRASDIIQPTSWLALKNEWFTKLMSVKDIKMIRQAVYLLLRDTKFYKQVADRTLGKNANASELSLFPGTRNNIHKLALILNQFNGESSNTQNRAGHVFELISREIVESNLSLSQTELLSQ